MSQSPFGSPNAFGQIPSQPGPAPSAPVAPEPEEPGRSRTKLLILGGAGLAALVLAGGAAMVLTSGGDDETDLAAVAPKPAATSSPSTTQAPAPLPTSVQFAGRNPFKAKIVEGSGGGGGGAAAGGGGSTGSGSVPTTAPGTGTGGLGGPGTTTTVFIPGPTVTRTVQVPGPTTTTPGPTRTVYLLPGAIELTYLGTDLADPAPEETPEDFVPDDPALADFRINDEVIQDVEVGDTFAYYFQLLDLKQDGETDEAQLRFGDALGWVTKDQTEKF
jgi:hypothetical protein